ncbi:hypothetical protein L292_3159 [Acinetobacter junii CIP 107470 = MTCC 11364]|uniref:Uncharacterized protein n=1 Tax=Acinetobacter junii CIP 107470 = MTCC 11364 TaxID=1217666 RepID=S7Y3Q0_ACIJU|nr:hypothetical protein F953_00535 [Acinetobacter junii CIP 107470 = MTCC 11364]EPR85829.1 hypothetical protein L292_3159 [Acinetobacter junii CIP 107470 = MTCC 11364]
MSHSIHYYKSNVQPYLLYNYRQDAKTIIIARIAYLKTNPVRPIPTLELQVGGKTIPHEPKYAAKWSSLARKRKAGLLLILLYYIADKHGLDMTSTLAQRLLEGWLGHSISNKLLIKAFGQTGRTAEDKTKDLDQLDELIGLYKNYAFDILQRDKRKMKLIKETLWNELNPENKHLA